MVFKINQTWRTTACSNERKGGGYESMESEGRYQAVWEPSRESQIQTLATQGRQKAMSTQKLNYGLISRPDRTI